MRAILNTIAGVLLAAASSSTLAAPTFFFDGNFNYDSSTGLMTIDAVIDGSNDVIGPDATGSTFDLVTKLYSTELSGSFVKATFDTDLNPFLDFNVVDSGDTLLEGNVNNFNMQGLEGSDFGFLSGFLDSESGVLANNFFTETSLFALELNLTTGFALSMFDQNFSGQIDGQLVGVPGTPVQEPGTLFLLGWGAVGLVFARKLNEK